MIKHLLTATGIMASMLLSAIKNFNSCTKFKRCRKIRTKRQKNDVTEYKLFSLNIDGIKSELAKAPNRDTKESLILKFPNVSGNFVDYVVQEAEVLWIRNYLKNTGIKSYLGYEKDNNGNTIRFSISPYDGMNIMYFDNWDVSYMDTYSNDLSNYIVYKNQLAC
jgi:hypothetical protein